MEQLVESLCEQSGLMGKTEFRFEDFYQILSSQMDKLWNASIDWKGKKRSGTLPYTGKVKNVSSIDWKDKKRSGTLP